MGLPPKRAKKFEEEITQLIPHKNMYVNVTQQDRNLADYIAQMYYGNSFKQEREEKLAEKKARLQERKEKEQVIINLYRIKKMTTEEIAEITGMEIKKIQHILKDKNIE